MAKTKGARSRLVSAKAANRRSSRKPVSMHMVRRVRSKKVHKQTGIEATVEKWLLAAEVHYKSEYAISRTHVDFYLPDTKTIVEVNGCYFHACKQCGRELSTKQMRWRRRDGRRYTFFRNAGYNLVLVWEHEIEGDPELAREKVLKHALAA